MLLRLALSLAFLSQSSAFTTPAKFSSFSLSRRDALSQRRSHLSRVIKHTGIASLKAGLDAGTDLPNLDAVYFSE
jgi:hypothetical protein